MVHNYTTEQRTASVSIEAKGLEAMGNHAATTGALASAAERRDDWRFAAKAPGAATITATARTESDVDAVELPIPILPFGIHREVGTSGSVVGAGDATATVNMPSGSNPAARSISITLAPSLAGSLLGALDYLTEYPYGCTEQIVSSFLPNLLVTRSLTELKLLPTEHLPPLDRQVHPESRILLAQHDMAGGWGRAWKNPSDRLRRLGDGRSTARWHQGGKPAASPRRGRGHLSSATRARADPRPTRPTCCSGGRTEATIAWSRQFAGPLFA